MDPATRIVVSCVFALALSFLLGLSAVIAEGGSRTADLSVDMRLWQQVQDPGRIQADRT